MNNRNKMGHKCYISFKMEDKWYKETIQKWNDANKVDLIDKSLNEPIDSDDEDYIMRKIREDYLTDSFVTIFLIGNKSSENMGWEEQKFIKRELQASLYDGEYPNNRNGILGIVLPSMYDVIYQGSHICDKCGHTHNWVNINDNTVIKEFSANYYIKPLPNGKCAWYEEDRYCVLVKWDEFKDNPNKYINDAFNKRSQQIASKVKVYPK